MGPRDVFPPAPQLSGCPEGRELPPLPLQGETRMLLWLLGLWLQAHSWALPSALLSWPITDPRVLASLSYCLLHAPSLFSCPLPCSQGTKAAWHGRAQRQQHFARPWCSDASDGNVLALLPVSSAWAPPSIPPWQSWSLSRLLSLSSRKASPSWSVCRAGMSTHTQPQQSPHLLPHTCLNPSQPTGRARRSCWQGV